jgi:acid phosphatase family membrane protein YuiD
LDLLAIFENRALVASLIAWGIATALKLPIEFARTRRWKWVLVFRPGGMPSSHSALVAAAAHGVGLAAGFDSPIFALGVVIAMVVIYDAMGIRRQAGRHAEIINTIIQGLVEGHPLRQEQLREVLGHSPLEAILGMTLGVVTAQLTFLIWPL